MISVCMATYNGEKYITEQLASIIAQLSVDDEIVIVDDCSTDRTVEIIMSFGDERIKIHINSINMGVVKAFECAIVKSTGDYIFLCDQDDIWLPTKVQTTLNGFRHYNADLIVSDAYILEYDQLSLDTFYQFRNSGGGLLKNFVKNTFIGCCMAFDSRVKKQVLPFPADISMHDFWLGMAISITGKVKFIDDRLVIYRRHSNNVTDMSPSQLPDILATRIRNLIILLRYSLYYMMKSLNSRSN